MPYLKLEILSKLFLNINSNNQEIETLQKIETSLKKYSNFLKEVYDNIMIINGQKTETV